MGWPKGKPRKGYVKKDGTPHATKGSKLQTMGVPRKAVATSAKSIVSTADEVVPNLPGVRSASSYEGPIHGMKGNNPISEVCPKCGYVYADGGYCPDCGWMKAIVVDAYGTHQGRRF